MNEGELKLQFRKAADYFEALAVGYKTIALGYNTLAFEMATTMLTELANDPEPEKFSDSARKKTFWIRRYYHKPGKKTVLIDEFYAIAKSKVDNEQGKKS